jgi:gas vesicle protein
MACRGDFGARFTWFLLGIGVGSVVALLYAPSSGRETRRLITKRAEEAGDFITEEIIDRGKEFVEDATKLVEKTRKLAAV